MGKSTRMTKKEAEYLGLEPKNHNQYNLGEKNLRKLYKYRGYDDELIESCIERGINPNNVGQYWYKSKHISINVKKDLENTKEQILDKFEQLISDIKFKPIKLKPTKGNSKACKITISDSHVGMNPSPDKSPLFKYEYNSEIYGESLNKVYESVIKEYNIHGAFDILFLDDLGDLADGWNGYTTRGGHKLPQNMTNADVFEVCVDAKVRLIRNLVESRVANKIILRCVTNDNHSGDFSLLINKAIEKIINLIYDKSLVKVDILTKFIDHRVYGNHCFILTHGKDKSQMKFGLPIVLNDKAIRLINDYIDHYDIDSKYIHVEKGDLHQIGYQRTKKFDYRNFMSFAPPSSWIQHNFGDSYSGYSIQIIPKDSNEISHTDYFLDYKKISDRNF